MEYFKFKIETENKANSSGEGIFFQSSEYYVPSVVKQEKEERGMATIL